MREIHYVCGGRGVFNILVMTQREHLLRCMVYSQHRPDSPCLAPKAITSTHHQLSHQCTNSMLIGLHTPPPPPPTPPHHRHPHTPWGDGQDQLSAGHKTHVHLTQPSSPAHHQPVAPPPPPDPLPLLSLCRISAALSTLDILSDIMQWQGSSLGPGVTGRVDKVTMPDDNDVITVITVV